MHQELLKQLHEAHEDIAATVAARDTRFVYLLRTDLHQFLTLVTRSAVALSKVDREMDREKDLLPDVSQEVDTVQETPTGLSAPRCQECDLPAEPTRRGFKAYHRHCCYKCRLWKGKEHSFYCCSQSVPRAEATPDSREKGSEQTGPTEDGHELSAVIGRNAYLSKDCDVDLSLVQNHVLDLSGTQEVCDECKTKN